MYLSCSQHTRPTLAHAPTTSPVSCRSKRLSTDYCVAFRHSWPATSPWPPTADHVGHGVWADQTRVPASSSHWKNTVLSSGCSPAAGFPLRPFLRGPLAVNERWPFGSLPCSIFIRLKSRQKKQKRIPGTATHRAAGIFARPGPCNMHCRIFKNNDDKAVEID